MSLFATLYTSSAGMNAQTRSTSVISENIANMTTTGYKRSNTAFQEIVNSNKMNLNQSGSVATERINRITQPGSIQQTGIGTDVAIAGNGFFVVREDPTDPLGRDLYTRNGEFGTDALGYMRNSAGYTLFGWEVDATGTVNTGALVPVDIDLLATTARPTSFAEMALNLDANQVSYDPHSLTPAQQLPVSNQTTHFSRSVTVYDGNGTGRPMTFEFRKIIGPMASFTSNSANTIDYNDVLAGTPSGPTPGILSGDTLAITDGTNALNVTLVNTPPNAALNEARTMRDTIAVINNFTDVSGNQVFTARLTDTGKLIVQANDPAATIDISASSATVLGFSGLNIVPDPLDADYIYAPQASLTANGTANPNQTDFPAFANAATPNPYGWWEMTVRIPDPAAPTSTTLVELSKGLINFNGNGSLNAAPGTTGQIEMNFPAIDFDLTDATDDLAGLSFDMTGFTQFSGTYTVGYVDQNGAPLGTLVDTEITEDGDVLAVFSNGIKLESFRIPLATFINPDGLDRITGTAFSESEESGAVTLQDAMSGGAGALQVAAVENSNVDIAEEFSNIIISQRAYSLNGQIINAVNEMTQTLTRLKG